MVRFVNFLDRVYWTINMSISTLSMRFYMHLIGIKIQNGSKFYGLAKFKRSYVSGSITIGNNAIFRSDALSNLIGINRPCIISVLSNNAKLVIGDNCGFSGTVIGCFSEVVIGNNVRCGANTLITDSDWHPEDNRSSINRPIFIGNNVWLGVNVSVLKGVKIGENSVIGAGSIVTHDIPDNVIAGGVPCKVIRNLSL